MGNLDDLYSIIIIIIIVIIIIVAVVIIIRRHVCSRLFAKRYSAQSELSVASLRIDVVI